MHRPNGQKPKERPAPTGNQLVTFDAQLAKQQEEAQLAKERPKKNEYLDVYTGPKVKWEDTGLYKALVKSQDIEEELTKIRNLIRKRTDPGYEPNDEEDFKVAPIRKFDSKNDYYRLLEVDDFASVKDIKGAYKRLALQYHPDKNRDKKPDKLREMQDEFEKIQEAYEILSDRATRRQYDRARFDEARAKSQGMNSSFYSQKTNSDSNFWGRWSGKKEGRSEGVNAQEVQNLLKSKAPKLPKAAALRFEIKISLEKALRGGLKIREVKRDRMQRAFGGTNQNLKTVNIKIDPGQADGSEYRLEGDGHWPSFNTTPGDLVVVFRHKPHAFLRQSNKETGALQLAMPLTVRAKATDPVLSAWSPTFKGSMVLIRFQNPLLKLAPNKACNVTFVIDGEGLPVPGELTRRGPLGVTVHVQLDGNPLVPSMNAPCCKDVVAKRHLKNYNHQAHLRVSMSNPRAAGFPVRKFVAGDAKERGGLRLGLASVAVIWESSPGTDPVAFGKAAAALGHHAQLNPQGYGWCCNTGLLRQALPNAGHVALADEELASESEDERANAKTQEVFKASAGQLTKQRRVRKPRPEVESFLLRFNLGPPEGFPDSADEEELRSPVEQSPTFAGQPGQATAELRVEGGKEGDEEAELTRLIREKQSELDAAKRRWSERKERQQGEREEEEGLLRDLLEKDKKRELERVEREMNGLRSTFEFQLQAEKKWVDEFISTNNYQNQWVCVFKPAMVIRKKPAEDGPITRRIMCDEVIKAKGKVTDDYWIQLETDEWALTWHKVHGQLLQRWFGTEQQRYLDLQAKIEERRKGRNETFVAYRRKKKEIEQWSIPPGPSEEEKCELEDEEGEQLHFVMEPIVKEMKDYKRRLRELRQKRFEAEAERQRRDAGAEGLAAAPLPAGFEAALGSEEAQAAQAPEAKAETETAEQRPWEETKQAADKAFKDKEWNTALSLYGQALELGGDALESAQRATLMSNRALVFAKLFDWAKSLEDAVDATIQEPDWPKALCSNCWVSGWSVESQMAEAPCTSLERQGGGLEPGARLVLRPLKESSEMVCLASFKYVLEKPLTLMGCSIILSLVVPIVARLAGNNDPDENSISHVFGQGSICVAMDFPGWVEAATVMFFITGLMHGYAIYKVYRHCQSEWQGKFSKRFLQAVAAFVILTTNCFWLVGVFSPVLSHRVDTVFAHSIPYVGLQIGFWCWAIFLMAFVYVFGGLYVGLQVFLLVFIFWTFAELSQPGVQLTGADRYKGPMPRGASWIPLSEPVTLFCRLCFFFLHPLRVESKGEGQGKGEQEKGEVEKDGKEAAELQP
ncbi:DnaJ-1 [Symbiodinium sp. CCMP2456]|nr:DnaJ-1 [Symbiodinium sp. CCMP2456]